ncbi:50S ribosomal protein L13 [candidate division WOR-3 bacterium]|nr:50S ribosomal protein L13 [candidate division WOR-3 bacterium]
MKTYVPKLGEINKKWVVVDAKDKSLGRLASGIAKILRGKNKPNFTPFLDCGDNVICVNAEKVMLTGKKLDQKIYWRHSGYMSGITLRTARQVLQKNPERLIEKAVKGMLPKGPLGRKMLRNLKVCKGSEHGHAAQKPEQISI